MILISWQITLEKQRGYWVFSHTLVIRDVRFRPSNEFFEHPLTGGHRIESRKRESFWIIIHSNYLKDNNFSRLILLNWRTKTWLSSKLTKLDRYGPFLLGRKAVHFTWTCLTFGSAGLPTSKVGHNCHPWWHHISVPSACSLLFCSNQSESAKIDLQNWCMKSCGQLRSGLWRACATS